MILAYQQPPSYDTFSIKGIISHFAPERQPGERPRASCRIGTRCDSRGRAPGEQNSGDEARRLLSRFPQRRFAHSDRQSARQALVADVYLRAAARNEELHVALASPEVLRHGDRVKVALANLDATQLALLTPYEQ
jgi:hypothetical protein